VLDSSSGGHSKLRRGFRLRDEFDYDATQQNSNAFLSRTHFTQNPLPGTKLVGGMLSDGLGQNRRGITMSREQIVRDTAYAIWEAEGKPQGRDQEHWSQAEARVAASVTGQPPVASAKMPPSAKTADADAKPPAKKAAAKASPSVATVPKKPTKAK